MTRALLVSLLSLSSLSFVACGGVSSYIAQARRDVSVATRADPPTCNDGERGKRAVIDAFKQDPSGHMPVATFMSLACYRSKVVHEAIGPRHGDGPLIDHVQKASVPIDRELVDTMAAAWKANADVEQEPLMTSAFYSTDLIFTFALYDAIMASGKPFGRRGPHPKGAYFPIDKASPAETEAIRRGWCEHVAKGALSRFLDASLPKSSDSSVARDDTLAGLLGNGCDEADKALIGMIERVDREAVATEAKLGAQGLGRDGVLMHSKIALGKGAEGWPLVPHVGNEIVVQALVEPGRARRYLALLDRTPTSCAFADEMLAGIDAKMVEKPEASQPLRNELAAYRSHTEARCRFEQKR